MEKHCKDCDWSPKVENVEALEKRLDELIDGMASVGRLAVEEQGIAHAVECQCRLCRIIRIVRAHVPITLQERIDEERNHPRVLSMQEAIEYVMSREPEKWWDTKTLWTALTTSRLSIRLVQRRIMNMTLMAMRKRGTIVTRSHPRMGKENMFNQYSLKKNAVKVRDFEGRCGTCKHWGSDGPGPVDEFTDDELDDNLKWCPATCGFTSAGADCEGVNSNYEKRTEKQDKSNGS